jgi:hypothetical protein
MGCRPCTPNTRRTVQLGDSASDQPVILSELLEHVSKVGKGRTERVERGHRGSEPVRP